MISFLFSLFLSLNITGENWFDLTKNSEGPPIFIFSFAEWCPHCNEIVPSWKALREKYESNEDVIIASLDCSDNNFVCFNLNIRSMPTFIFQYQGKSRIIHPQRTIPGFVNVAEKLISIYQLEKKIFGKIFSDENNLPAFICRMEETEEMLDIVTENGLTLNTNFFFNSNVSFLDNDQCCVFFDKTEKRTMKDYVLFTDFVRENKIGFFSKKWTIESLFSIRRLFAIPLSAEFEKKLLNSEDNKNDIILKHEDEIAWGSFESPGFEKIQQIIKIDESINKSNSILIVNGRNERKICYFFLENVESETIIVEFLDLSSSKGEFKWNEVKMKGVKGNNKINLSSETEFAISGIIGLVVISVVLGFLVTKIVKKRFSHKNK
ncbi:hypothetical protein TRFO_38043 [Tritrichomonas foetus]|uniref:Thioredoxin domain-containing protein n=1 Tax=Tritrichomonas foetus TaxID=1144522 RepID=A0A1J4JEY3_9EUKA|nr:hypothetical protein TRFO_38043 [Tritrichomonas foetus]|eukprot:OHS95820.1 hypothetical protein TRFO_38043 [Tritrichomonas foetus]